MVGEINFGLVDPGLSQRYAQPFARGRANALAEQQGQQTNAMNAIRMQQAQQQIADENAMRQLYSQSGGDIGKVVSGLTEQGQYKPAMELQSQMAMQQQAQREAKIKQAREHLGLIKDVSTDIAANPTLENAMSKLQFVGQATGQDMTREAASLQALGNNPEAIKQWALSHAVSVDQILPKFHEIQAGGQVLQGAISPLTGEFTAKQALQKTQTPESMASERTAALGRTQAERHFQQQQGLEREKFAAGQVEKVGSPAQRKQEATDAIAILQQAAPLIDKATASGAGSLADIAAGFVGKSTTGANAAAQLKVLGGALVSKMPKMSGPQSDKDVLLYKEMAGRIGDPTVPREQKKAAMQSIMELQAKYAGVETPKLSFKEQSTLPSGWSVEEH